MSILGVLAYIRVGLEINSGRIKTGTPSTEGNLAIGVKIRKARALLGIYSTDLLKHAKHLVHKVLHYSIYL